MVARGFSTGLLLIQLFGALVTGKSDVSSTTPLYKDASVPVDKRVEDLLSRMTIEDKMAQLMQGTLCGPPWILHRSCSLVYRGCHKLDEPDIGRVQL